MPRLKPGTVPKTRSDSKLAKLPSDAQADLLARLRGTDSLEQTQAWVLATHRVRTSESAMVAWRDRQTPATHAPVQLVAVEREHQATLKEIQASLARIEKHLGIVRSAALPTDLE